MSDPAETVTKRRKSTSRRAGTTSRSASAPAVAAREDSTVQNLRAAAAGEAPEANDGTGDSASAPAAWHASWAIPMVDAASSALPNLPLVANAKLDALRAEYLAGWGKVWQSAQPVASAPEGTSAAATDRYFSAEAWHGSPSYRLLVDLYHLNARTLIAMAEASEGDASTRARLRFLVDQWVAATSPANVLALNPQAQQALIDSQGETLRKGIDNLLRDLQIGRVTQSDPDGFEIGVDLASTPGTVIAETPLMQLIQYTPTGTQVHTRPLLIVPPCINKYYVLDLRPRNSLVRYALDAGQQVFMISWRNPDASQAAHDWDDYVDAILQAITACRAIAAVPQINALGFCVGGALLACAAAVDKARGENRLASLTLLTTMLDYTDTGVLDVFIDEAHVAMRERTIGALATTPGLMTASEFANTFSLLRPRDLFWNYVVDNYMLGGTPPAFDLLFWNGDSTNLPGPMFAWYLRNMYLENKLREPGQLTVCGVPIDLRTLTMPCFIYGSRDDHIVPWRSAYASRALVSGETCFVLGASGHIAGVVNPPAANKRSYWVATGVETAAADGNDADAWLAAASEQMGSWWPTWSAWLIDRAGPKKRAKRAPGGAGYDGIEPAPGRYVKRDSSMQRGIA